MRVVNAIILQEESILLIKRRGGLHSGKWAFPGGNVKKEENELSALKRELKEEVGLDLINIIKEISNYSYFRENSLILGTSFLVNASGKIKINNKEVCEYGFFSLEEMEKLDLAPGIEEESIKAISQ